MSKSNNNGYKKKVQMLMKSDKELAGHHRQQALHDDLIGILKEFRTRCEELACTDGLNDVMHEFGPKTMVILDRYLGKPGVGRIETRVRVRNFLIEEFETIEGSYRDQVHQ